MPLKLFEANLENVRRELHGEYEKQSDGRYKLMLEDFGDLEDVRGLRSALKKCREELKELRATGGMPDAVAARTPFSEMLRAKGIGSAPDVRAGLLPRRGTPRRG